MKPAPSLTDPSDQTRRVQRFGVAAALALLPPVLLAGVLPMGGVSALEDDLLYYFPQRAFLGQVIRSGHLPLWDPYVGMAESVVADPQVGLWYPPTHLFVLLSPFAAYLATLWVHFVLAGAGMYRLARCEGRSRSAALLAGVAFEFGGFLIAHRVHLTILESAAWVPWVILAWARFGTRRRSGDFLFAVLLLGVQLLVQHVQISMITIALALGYLLLLFPHRLKHLAIFGVGVLLSVGVAAVQFVPTFAHFLRCTRSETTFDTLVENSYWPQSAVMLFWPMLFGTRTPNFYQQPYWGPSHWCEQAVYPSLLVMVLAIAGLRAVRRDRVVRTWAILAAGATLLALGRLNPLYGYLHSVPLVNSLRVPARWMLGVSVALPLLAAWTLDRLRAGDARINRHVRRTAARWVPAMMAVLLAIGWSLGWWGPIPYPTSTGSEPAGALSFMRPAVYVPIFLGVLTSWVLVGPRRRGALWTTGVLTLLVIDLASVALFVDVDMTTYSNRSELLRSPLAEHIADRDETKEGRLWVPRFSADYQRPVEVLWPHLNVLHGVRTLHGYGPLMTREYRALWQFRPWGASDAALDWLLRPALLEAMNVRWLAVQSEAERELVDLAGRGWKPGESLGQSKPGQWHELADGKEFHLDLHAARAELVRIDFQVRPLAMGRGIRFFVRMDDASGSPIGPIRYFEPADLAFGQRRFRLHFPIHTNVTGDNVVLRMGSFRGKGVAVADVRCRSMVAADSPESAWSPPAKVGDVSVYELRNPAKRVAFMRNVIGVDSMAKALDVFTVEGDPATLARAAVVVDPSADKQLPSAAVRKVIERPNETDILVDAPNGGFLLVRDSYDPGWQAEVDGKPTPVLRANVLCQGVRVPPGARQVRFEYRPVGLVSGGTLSAITLVGLLGVGILARRQRRSSKPPSGAHSNLESTRTAPDVYNGDNERAELRSS